MHRRVFELRNAAIAMAILWLARPEAALACAVCFGEKDSDWPAAFLAGTILMLALPPAIVICAGVAIYRATKRQEARIAARDAEQAAGVPAGAPERPLRLV